MVPHTIPWRNFNFPRSNSKIKFFDKISTSAHLEKFIDLIKNPKYEQYEHQSIFPCGGGSNLILGTGRKNQTIIFSTHLIFEKIIRMEKFLSEKKIVRKKLAGKTIFVRKTFVRKNFIVKKILLEKYVRKKNLGKQFL